MSSILKVQNLKYKGILNDVSFEIKDKSFNILFGPNGCGKTTLVKAILGLIDYTGEIFFENNLLKKETVKAGIGVMTSHSILEEKKVISNIIYPLINLNYSDEQAKIKVYDISKKLNIGYLLFKDADELSSSERKLVDLACALVSEPRLIVIDDTLEKIDNKAKNKIINYLKGLKKSTVIFITNNVEDFLLADNIIIMNDGRIMEVGTPEELFKNEKLFVNNNSSLPFVVDLFNKLKFYDLIDSKEIIFDLDELVDKIWK